MLLSTKNDSFDLDRFRIKIWDEYEIVSGEIVENIIYDNGCDIVGCADELDDNATTEINGGSIVIRKK